MALKHSKKEIRAVGLQGKNYNLRRQYEKETKGGKYAIFMNVGVIENSSLAKLNEMIINIMNQGRNGVQLATPLMTQSIIIAL